MAEIFRWFIILLLYRPVLCQITGPTQLHPFVGEFAHFSWQTDDNSSILFATWGIKKHNTADPQFINVDIRSTRINVNSDLPQSLRKRLSFDGDLKKGRVWFTLKDVTVNDTNTYIAFISDDVSRVLPFTAVLTVKKRKKQDGENEVTNQSRQALPTVFSEIHNTSTTKEIELVNAPNEPKQPVLSTSHEIVYILATVGVILVVVVVVMAKFGNRFVKCKNNKCKRKTSSSERDKLNLDDNGMRQV